MRLSKFPAGVEATEADFNAISENTEAGFKSLIRVLASANTDSDYVLFKQAVPTIAGVGPWTVTVPHQYFSIDGVVAELSQTTFSVSAASNRKVAVFLRIQKSDVTATRGYLDLSGARPVRATDTFVMARSDAAAIITVDPYVDAGDNPVAGADDVGTPINLAILEVTGVGSSPALAVFTYDPDSRLWAFPAGTPPTDHASTHLTGGGDAIDLATTTDDGLMAHTDLQTVRESLTDLTRHVSNEFLTVTIAGDNVSAPKTVQLNVRLFLSSLAVIDDNGTKKIGLNFRQGGRNGTANQPARADHSHSLNDNPIVVTTRVIEVNSPLTMLGALQTVNLPTSFGSVISVSAKWAAPGLTAPYYPLVDAGWDSPTLNGVLKRVGVRYTVTGNNQIQVLLGSDALCEMSVPEQALVTTVTGSVTWDSVSGSYGLMPTTGYIVLTITGVRNGITIPA